MNNRLYAKQNIVANIYEYMSLLRQSLEANPSHEFYDEVLELLNGFEYSFGESVDHMNNIVCEQALETFMGDVESYGFNL
jgi:hypothetical protein